MKVILYERDNSILSRLVKIVTGSRYTHTAVLLKHGNVCYFSDSSLNDGIVVTPKYYIPDYLKTRKYKIYQLNNTTTETDYDAFIKMSELAGEDYDVKGAKLWLLYRFLKTIGLSRKNKKLYCFEYTLEILSCYYTIDEDLKYTPSGDTIRDFMVKNGTETRFLNCNKVG